MSRRACIACFRRFRSVDPAQLECRRCRTRTWRCGSCGKTVAAAGDCGPCAKMVREAERASGLTRHELRARDYARYMREACDLEATRLERHPIITNITAPGAAVDDEIEAALEKLWAAGGRDEDKLAGLVREQCEHEDAVRMGRMPDLYPGDIDAALDRVAGPSGAGFAHRLGPPRV